LIETTARDLFEGKIVGWMDGALELGPRALGHRSILAAPHSVECATPQPRHQASRAVSALRAGDAGEAAERYFEMPSGRRAGWRVSCPAFSRCIPEWRGMLAAVTMSTGTARVPGAGARHAPRLYALLKAYGGSAEFLYCSHLVQPFR